MWCDVKWKCVLMKSNMSAGKELMSDEVINNIAFLSCRVTDWDR